MNKNEAVNLAKREWENANILVTNDVQKKGGERVLSILKDDVIYTVNFIHKNESGSLILHIKPDLIEKLENPIYNKGFKPALSINLSYTEDTQNYLLMATYTLDQLKKLINDSEFYPIAIEKSNVLFRYQNETSRNQLIKTADIFGFIISI